MTTSQLLATAFVALAISGIAAPAATGQPTSSIAAPPAPELSAAEWREDLQFMAAEMKRRHKNLYHTVSPAQFDKAVADLHARIPSLQRHEIIVEMMRIAAMVGDGHTRVDPRKDPKFNLPSLPLKLYLFEDGLFVRAAAPEHAGLVGARIEAIGGVPVAEAMSRAAAISARDNDIGPKLFIPIYLNMPHILHALKLSSSTDKAVLTLRKGERRWNTAVPAGNVDPVWPPDTDISLMTPAGWIDARITPKPPMWLEDPLDYHRIVEMPDQKALYVQLNMVTHVKGQTIGQFADKIAERAKATNPEAIILDLRLNQGGNGGLRDPLVRKLIKAEDEDTRLFVLTARGTFSASQFILDDLDRLSQAVFIGEPASSKPSSYGDAYKTPLPNSGIGVRSSIKWWQAGQNFDPWTWVDVAAPLSFADYAAGRDPALEAALNYEPGPTLTVQLIDAAKSGGTAAVRKTLQAYRSDPANRYANQNSHLLDAAQRLSFAKHGEEALFVATAATEQFPQDADAFLVLAHVGEWNERFDIARAAAAKTLEIDPHNRTIRSLLERISAK